MKFGDDIVRTTTNVLHNMRYRIQERLKKEREELEKRQSDPSNEGVDWEFDPQTVSSKQKIESLEMLFLGLGLI